MQTSDTKTHDELSRRIIQLAAAQVGLTEEDVSLDSNFGDDLGYDSLDSVEFTMEIEDQFDLTLPDDVANKILTVGQAVDEIRKLLESSS